MVKFLDVGALQCCTRCGFEGCEVICGPLGNQCPTCLGWTEPKPFDRVRVLRFVCLALAVVAALCMLVSLTACGQPFSAAAEPLTISSAGAGGYAQTMPQAGAGAATFNPNAAAGASGGASPAAGASGATLSPHACGRAQWTASAFGWSYEHDAGGVAIGGGPPSAAVDDDPSSAWSSGAEQDAGQWFTLELGSVSTLSSITLRSAALLPRLTLELDGEPVAVTATSAPGALELAFAPKPAHSVRLVLEQHAPSTWTLEDVSAVCQ